MKSLVNLLVLVVLSFNHCITNQRDACETKIAVNDSDMNICIDSLIASKLFISASKDPNAVNDPNSLGNQWANVALLKCLTALQNEKKCSKKSQYIPVYKAEGY